jgi:hypothetical protein
MNVTWVVENFTEGDDIFMLIQSIKDAGHKLVLINRLNGFKYEHIQFENECVIFYGSIQMAKLVSNHLKTCSPVVWEDMDKFECTTYYPYFKDYLFNDKHELMPFKQLKDNKFDIYSKFGKDAFIFLRPSGGSKSFAGQIIDLQDFDRFCENNIVCNAKDTDIVVVSTPKNIKSEFRFIVTAERKIVAMSCYKFQNKITSIAGAPTKAIELVKKVLAVGYYPGKMFSLDVAEDDDGEFWLLEFNSFNSCGFYACNKRPIVDEASRLAIEEFTQNSKTLSGTPVAVDGVVVKS